MRPYAPGESLEELQRRSNRATIIKLNANENPLGTSPLAAEAVRSLENLQRYGDDTNAYLKEMIGARCGVRAENVVLGHGSNELISLAAGAFLSDGSEAVMATPAFSLFRVATTLYKAQAVFVPLVADRYDIAGMLAALTPQTKIVFICDPNNPTGGMLEGGQWKMLLAGLPESVALVIDQAYVEYAERLHFDSAQLVLRRPKTLVLRTLSKVYGLAAVRFGYGYADAATVALLNQRRTPYNVSRPAAAAAAAAFDDVDFLKHTLAANAAGRTFLTQEIDALGLDVYPSQANFLSVGVPVGADRATEDLLSRGIAVRSGDALGMPGRLRISIGTHSDNQAVVDALRELLPEWIA